ncbi:MAG: helix-turn-helix domain-containing protein [Acidimicrobiales bacterium]
MSEAASQLRVSRRRVVDLIARGVLPADRVGNQWTISSGSLRAFAHNQLREAGRPLSQSSAWRLIRHLEDGPTVIPSSLDRQRRRLRARADHVDAYVHPGLFPRVRVDDRVVLGGRDAAQALGAPVDPSDSVDLYVRGSQAAEMMEAHAIRGGSRVANVHLHVVHDDAWPFGPGLHVVGAWAAWLDLADVEDRASTVVLDRIARGASRA